MLERPRLSYSPSWVTKDCLVRDSLLTSNVFDIELFIIPFCQFLPLEISDIRQGSN